MRWKTFKLYELCEMNSGGTPRRGTDGFYGGEIPWAKIRDIETAIGGSITQTEEYITEEGLRSIRGRMFPKGSLLLAMYGSVGKTAFAGVDLSTNQAILGIRIKDQQKVNAKFLKYWFDFNKQRLLNRAVGGTIQNISLGIVKQLEIPLPPLPIQKQIADTLDKADALRRKEQELLNKYDELVQSIFYEMFGNPVTNEHGWVQKKLGDVTALITKGESPKWQGFDYVDSGVLFLTSENVGWGNLLLEDKTKFIPGDFHKKLKRSQLVEGDVLINLVGASIGRTAIVNDNCIPANINQAVALLRPSEYLDSEFLNAVLLTQDMQRIIRGGIVDAARANISLKNLDELIVIVPPLEKQLRFKTCVEIMKKQKELLTQIPNMFHALLNRLFS